MTLSKGDKTDLIKYRLNQARETADTATELFRNLQITMHLL